MFYCVMGSRYNKRVTARKKYILIDKDNIEKEMGVMCFLTLLWHQPKSRNYDNADEAKQAIGVQS